MVTKKGIQKASEILVKEIKILRELTALHHPNLVAMHDCMDSPAYVYVVMEVSLFIHFKTYGRLFMLTLYKLIHYIGTIFYLRTSVDIIYNYIGHAQFVRNNESKYPEMLLIYFSGNIHVCTFKIDLKFISIAYYCLLKYETVRVSIVVVIIPGAV